MAGRQWVIGCLLALLYGAAAAQPPYQYLQHCSGCHLTTGEGAPPEVPDLRKDLVRISAIPEGRAYLIQVPGPSQAPISDAELAEVMNWIIGELNPDGADFVPYTAGEIAGYRGVTLLDPLKVRDGIWHKATADY